MTPSPACPFADEVVARLLDGDHDTATPLVVLDAHLQECEACRASLSRARRLDALVAATATIDGERHRVDMVLDRVQARLAARLEPATPRRRAPRRMAAAAAGLAVVWLLWPATPTSPEPCWQTPVGATVETAAFEPKPVTAEEWLRQRGAIVLSDELAGSDGTIRSAPPTSGSVPPSAATPRPATVEETQPTVANLEWAWGLLRPSTWTTSATAVVQQTFVARAVATAGSDDPDSWQQVETMILAPPSPARAAPLLSALRRTTFGSRLAQRLSSAPAVRPRLLQAAARLGGEAVDAALRDCVRGDRDRTEQVVTAASATDPRPGRIRLLLALWSDLQTRGLEAAGKGLEGSPAEDRARRWFASLPAPATDDLIAEAISTRHAGQRRRCLQALAARRDAAAVPYLLHVVVDGARLEESMLASQALGRCATSSDESRLLAALTDCRWPELLWAALASCRSQRFSELLPRLDLAAGDRALLLAGDFDEEQFAAAVTLLQRAHAAARSLALAPDF